MSFLGNLSNLSSEELARKFEEFPEAIRQYSSIFSQNQVDGHALSLQRDKNSTNELLSSLGVENNSHKFLLCQQLKALNDSFVHSTIISTLPTSNFLNQASSSTEAIFPPNPLNHHQINWSEISLPTPINKENIFLGRGGFSTVLKGIYHDNIVAVKVMMTREWNEVSNEIEILEKVSRLDEDLFVKLLGVCDGEIPSQLLKQLSVLKLFIPPGTKLGLILQYETGGNLETLLFPSSSPPSALSMVQKLCILALVAKALMILHSENIVHGDIKLENILLNEQTLKPRLSDFGLSRLSESPMSGDSLRMTKNKEGTICYMAPEQFIVDPMTGLVARPSRKTDVYSFSILIWEVLSGKRAFTGIAPHRIQGEVEDGLRPDIDVLNEGSSIGVSSLPGFPRIKDLLQRGWSKERSERPPMEEFYSTFNFLYNLMLEVKFDIFMSHVWAEKNFMCCIYKILQNQGLRVWYDQNDMGVDIKNSIKKGIDNSKVCLVCISQNYQNSPNCLFELRYALHVGKPILVLFVDPNPREEWLNQEVKELLGERYLRQIMWFDLGKHAKEWVKKEHEDNEEFLNRMQFKEKKLSKQLCEAMGVVGRLNEILSDDDLLELRPRAEIIPEEIYKAPPSELEKLHSLMIHFQDRVSGLQSRLSQFEGRVCELEGQKVGLEGRVCELEGQKVGLEGRVCELEGQKVVLEGRLSEFEGRVCELEGQKVIFTGRLSEFYCNRSAAYLVQGDAERALSDAEKCIELDGSYARGYMWRGTALCKLQRDEEAIAAFQAGLQRDPAVILSFSQAEKTLMARGDSQFQDGLIYETIRIYSQTIDLFPSASLYCGRSAAYMDQGHAERALSDAEKCIELDGSYARGYWWRGAALWRLQRDEEAIAVFQAGLQRDPAVILSFSQAEKTLMVSILKARGDSQFQDGLIEQAIKIYSQTIDLFPSALLYCGRSAAYLGQGDAERA